jgi:hypothetical protein
MSTAIARYASINVTFASVSKTGLESCLPIRFLARASNNIATTVKLSHMTSSHDAAGRFPAMSVWMLCAAM